MSVGGPPLPTADIKANGSDGPITIPYNTAATISWSSTNASSCTVSPPGWTGTSGSQSTGNLTSSRTYSLSCSGPGGSASDSVTVNVESLPTLSVTLVANPPSGTAPLNGVDLTATVSGNAAGTINYTFYCNRSDTGTNIIPGWDAKFDGITENPKTAVDACNYASGDTTYTAKVIVERGTALPAQAQQTVTVDWPALSASCSVLPTSANVGQSVTWTASPSGGTGSYSYAWSGSEGLSCPGQPSAACQSVTKSYSVVSPPPKTAQITVTSGSQTVVQVCSNSVTVSAPAPQCSDGIDNDGDWVPVQKPLGGIDYKTLPTAQPPGVGDPGCTSAADDDERNACSDGIDNDGDGKVDFDSTNWPGPGPWPGKDPGCSSLQDNSEANPPIFCEVNPDDPNATCL